MNSQIEQQMIRKYNIDLNNADQHDIEFYKQMVRIQERLAIKLGNYQIIEETYFPDAVWNIIKSFAYYERTQYLTKLRNKLTPITWGFKDLCQFGDSTTTYYQERRLYFLYIMQQCKDIEIEIYRRQNNLIN